MPLPPLRNRDGPGLIRLHDLGALHAVLAHRHPSAPVFVHGKGAFRERCRARGVAQPAAAEGIDGGLHPRGAVCGQGRVPHRPVSTRQWGEQGKAGMEAEMVRTQKRPLDYPEDAPPSPSQAFSFAKVY